MMNESSSSNIMKTMENREKTALLDIERMERFSDDGKSIMEASVLSGRTENKPMAGCRMTRQDNVELAKRMLVDSIYREARVEGIDVTFPETEKIFEGGIVDTLSFDDITKIVNLKHAWAFILDTLDYPFDMRYIRHLNALIEANLIRSAGIIRTVPVRISGTDWIPEIPSQESIEQELARIGRISDPTDRAFELMLSIMRGQYFEDGNKRTAQLAANQELIRNGCGIVSVPDSKRSEFSRLLVAFYETDSRMEIKEFLHDACLTVYDRKAFRTDEELEYLREEDRRWIENAVGNRQRSD